MKQNYAPKFVLVMLWFTAAVFGQMTVKVPICHVPPGNPGAASTILLNPLLASQHVFSSQHHDFAGDCWSGCTAAKVMTSAQGLQNNGALVSADRSNPETALGTPDGVNQVGGFYSLGFGGSIVLKMDGGILNRPGNDLLISETSFHQPSCDTYPEQAEIFVSENMVNWISLGVICQDAEVDIAPLDWILYVKIVDVSDPSSFSNVVDGFDVDGIQCINAPQQRSVAVEENPEFSLFSVPVRESLNIRYTGFVDADVLIVEVYDLKGRSELRTEVRTDGNQGTLEIPANQLTAGQHIVNITSSSGRQRIKFLKS